MSLTHLSSEPTSLVAVHDQCSQVEAWADQCGDVAELREASNRLAAIDAYLERTAREGRGRVAQTLRRLEVRIGEALGPPVPGRPTGENPNHGKGFNDRQRSEFRRMAERPDVVEQEVVNSTDEQPVSRRRVIDAIKRPEPRTVDDWPHDQQDMRRRLEAGETVVVSQRHHADLIGWAQAQGIYQRIDRNSPWGNPFAIPDDGDRAAVITNYRDHYLPHKPSLLAKLPELRGKALGCWCAPEPCHGDILAREANLP